MRNEIRRVVISCDRCKVTISDTDGHRGEPDTPHQVDLGPQRQERQHLELCDACFAAIVAAVAVPSTGVLPMASMIRTAPRLVAALQRLLASFETGPLGQEDEDAEVEARFAIAEALGGSSKP